jgi:hypothetical protein
MGRIMTFLHGTYLLSAKMGKCGSSVEYEYVVENGSYQIRQAIWIHAVVEKDGHLGAQLLIDGKRPLSGLPLEVQIRCGSPQDFGDMTAKQTPRLPEGFEPTTIKNAIGNCSYAAAFTDSETRQTFSETLYAELVVNDWLMTDLWSAVRTPGISIARVNMTLFGEHLMPVQDYVRRTYHWASERGQTWPAHIAEFQYMTENSTALGRE